MTFPDDRLIPIRDTNRVLRIRLMEAKVTRAAGDEKFTSGTVEIDWGHAEAGTNEKKLTAAVVKSGNVFPQPDTMLWPSPDTHYRTKMKQGADSRSASISCGLAIP